jgi:hypothetical protein
LPALSGQLARQWDLTVTSEWFRHGYNAVVVPVAEGGRLLALKLTWPPGHAQGEARRPGCAAGTLSAIEGEPSAACPLALRPR